jgi:hypothetical protein
MHSASIKRCDGPGLARNLTKACHRFVVTRIGNPFRVIGCVIAASPQTYENALYPEELDNSAGSHWHRISVEGSSGASMATSRILPCQFSVEYRASKQFPLSILTCFQTF